MLLVAKQAKDLQHTTFKATTTLVCLQTPDNKPAATLAHDLTMITQHTHC